MSPKCESSSDSDRDLARSASLQMKSLKSYSSEEEVPSSSCSVGVEEATAKDERGEWGRSEGWHETHEAARSEWFRRRRSERTDLTRSESSPPSNSQASSNWASASHALSCCGDALVADAWGVLSFTSSHQVMLRVAVCARWASRRATRGREWALSSALARASSGFWAVRCSSDTRGTPLSSFNKISPARNWL